SAAAPPKAKKEYEKGQALARKQQWDEAQQKFEKAVEVYPKYAVAWYELAQVQLEKNDPEAAKQSFRKSAAADPGFISPYEALAEIAMRQKRWQDLVDSTGELLKLNPVSFPQYWMYNGAGYYNLQNFDEAEKSATKGLATDPKHKVPKLEHLM